MNRLSPLISRRTGPFASSDDFVPTLTDPVARPSWLDDMKLFAVGWLGGLVFFGTFIG
jgi:hypothetical protein